MQRNTSAMPPALHPRWGFDLPADAWTELSGAPADQFASVLPERLYARADHCIDIHFRLQAERQPWTNELRLISVDAILVKAVDGVRQALCRRAYGEHARRLVPRDEIIHQLVSWQHAHNVSMMAIAAQLTLLGFPDAKGLVARAYDISGSMEGVPGLCIDYRSDPAGYLYDFLLQKAGPAPGWSIREIVVRGNCKDMTSGADTVVEQTYAAGSGPFPSKMEMDACMSHAIGQEQLLQRMFANKASPPGSTTISHRRYAGKR